MYIDDEGKRRVSEDSEVRQTHWNELVKQYDPVMSSDPAYRRMLEGIVELVPPSANRILDLGCGTGALTLLCHRAFPEAEIIGLDPAPKMIEQAKMNCPAVDGLSFRLGTAKDLSGFAEGSFDAVISNFALHHLTHDEKKGCAQETHRIVRRGGRFVFGDQHCQVMGEVSDPARVLHILDLLTAKAKYYLSTASFDRMMLQLELLPRFIKEDGEILATPEFWSEALSASGFKQVCIEIVEPRELMNRIIWGERPGKSQSSKSTSSQNIWRRDNSC